VAVKNQKITKEYAIYESDCMEVLPDLGKESIDLSIYSPPFAGLYNYSSSNNDFSNADNLEQFMIQYEYLIKEVSRVTKPGRMTVVHCQDVPQQGNKLWDFPGEIIKLHEKHGFVYHDRHMIWKEPLKVAIRTRSQGLMHKWIVKDSTRCRTALADYLLVFRKIGENKIPVTHEHGLNHYAGSNPVPEYMRDKYGTWEDVCRKYKNVKDQKKNKKSHIIWQRYASAFWDDIRIKNVLKYKVARDKDDEKHVHPLQLDVIERCVELWSNQGEIILTPFMGVGSEVYGAVMIGRKGIGIELKTSYYNQAVKNLTEIQKINEELDLFDLIEDDKL